MTAIAILLFLILCPCVSYIIVKRKVVPWSGGIFWVLGDDTLLPVAWKEFRQELPSDCIIKGIFFAGANASMMPYVNLEVTGGFPVNHATKEMEYYCLIPKEEGVFQSLCEPLDGRFVSGAFLKVSSPYPWKGHRECKCGSYYSTLQLVFRRVTDLKLPEIRKKLTT